jgi:excisionase family DNA binding protein
MTAQRGDGEAPVLLDVNEVARRLGTEPRFVRRLIAERRIEFHKVGRYVRISEDALADFIESGRMPVIGASEAWRSVRRSA